MIGVGRAKQNLNVVDRPLGKGKAELRTMNLLWLVMPQRRAQALQEDNQNKFCRTVGAWSLQDSRSLELKLVEALKRKEVEWQAWPKSFLAGTDAHSRRCSKICAAMERIQKAKQGLLTRMDNNQLEFSQSVASSPSESTGVESAPAK